MTNIIHFIEKARPHMVKAKFTTHGDNTADMLDNMRKAISKVEPEWRFEKGWDEKFLDSGEFQLIHPDGKISNFQLVREGTYIVV